MQSLGTRCGASAVQLGSGHSTSAAATPARCSGALTSQVVAAIGLSTIFAVMEATPIGGPPVFVLEEGWLVFNSGIRGIYDVIDEMDGHKLYGRRGDAEPDLTIIKHFTGKESHWRITRADFEDDAFLFTLRADVGGGTLEECVTSGRCPWFGPESQNGAGTKPKMVQRIDVVTLVGAEAEAKVRRQNSLERAKSQSFRRLLPTLRPRAKRTPEQSSFTSAAGLVRTRP